MPFQPPASPRLLTARTALLSCLLGLCLSLAGAADALADALFDRIPGAKQVFFLAEFATQRVIDGDDALTVRGILHGKQVKVVQTRGDAGRTFSIATDSALGLTLADLIPELRGFPGTDAFGLETLVVDEQKLTAAGTVNVRGVDFAASLDLKAKRLDVAATGAQAGKAGIGLLIPALKDAPVVSDFTFASAAFDLNAKTFTTTDALNRARMTALIDASRGGRNLVLDLKPAAAAVSLGDAIPALAGLPVLDNFTLADLRFDFAAKAVTVDIACNNALFTGSATAAHGPRSLVLDLKAAAQVVTLGQVLPALKEAPVVDGFSFKDLRCDLAARRITLLGALNQAEMTATLDLAKAERSLDLTPTSGKATPGQAIPALAGVPVLDSCGLENLRCDLNTRAVTALVSLNRAQLTGALSAAQGAGNLVLDLKAARPVTLADALAGLGDLPVVNDFSFTDLRCGLGTRTLSLTGALNQAGMTATIDGSKGALNPVFDLTPTAGKITPGQAIPDLQGMPVLDAFGLERLRCDLGAKAVTATASVNSVVMAGGLAKAPGGKGLVLDLASAQGPVSLGQVLTDLAGAPVVNDFTFERLHADLGARTLSLTGKLNAAEMTAAVDAAKGRRSIDFTATAGKVTPVQAIPDLAGLPVMEALGLENLRCDVSTKAVSATLSLNQAMLTGSVDGSKGPKALVFDLKATAGALTLGQALPDLASTAVINDFAFTELRCDLGARTLALTGTLNDAAMTATVDAAKGRRSIDFAATTGKVTPVQVFPALKDIPLLDAFGLENLHCDLSAKTLSATVSLNEAELTGTVNAGRGAKDLGFSLTASKGSVTLGDALPAVAQVPGVNAFALEGLFLKDNAFTADVSFMKAHAALTLKKKTTSAGGKGLDLDLTPVQGAVFDLASLFPELASLPGINDFKLVDLNFDELAKQLTASLNIGGILATLRTDSEKSGGKTGRVFTLTSPNLGLGAIVSSLQGLPVLGDLRFTELSIGPGFVEAGVDFAGAPVTLVENLAKGFAALDFGGLDVASVVPSLKNTVISDLKMASSLFLIMKNAGTISPDDFPEDRRSLLADFDFSKPLKAGVNLLASLNPGDLGKLAGPLKRLGLGAAKLPLNGSLPKGIFAFVEHAFKNKGQDPPPSLGASSLLKGITITVPVGAPRIAAVSKFATLDPAVLYVSGDLGAGSPWAALPKELVKYKPTGDVDIALQGGITLSIGSFKEDMVALVDLNVGEKAGALSLLALDRGSWNDPFGIKGLTVKDGGYVLSLSDGPSGARADLSFFGTAKLHDKDQLAVSAVFQDKGGLPTLEYFEIAGPVSLADVAGGIPNGKGCILRDLKVYPNGIEAQAELKSGGFDGKFGFYLFDITVAGKSTLAAALDLNTDLATKTRKNFSLSVLAKIAPLKGDKAKFITAKLDTMEVANACLVLSSQSLPVVTLADLKEGPAQDLFTRIFGKTSVPVRLDNVTLLSDFSTDIMGEIGQKLGKGAGGLKLGLDGGAVLNGAVGGLFDSDPLSLDLEILVDGGFSLDNLQKAGLKLPTFLKSKPDKVGAGQKAGLILKVLDETCEVGLLSGFDVELNKTTFDFTGTLGVQLAEEDIGLSLTGSMADTWKNALGIKGFAIEKVVVTGEVEEEAGDPSLKLGLAGETNILGRDFTLAGDASLGLGPGVPIPDGLGMLAASSQLDEVGYKVIMALLAGNEALAVIATPGNILAIPVIAIGSCVFIAGSEVGLSIYDAVHHKKATFKELISAPGHNAKVVIDKFAKVEAWLLGAKELQLSFATPGASDVNLGIPDGVHLSGKIELFGGAIKTGTIHIPLSWIYKVAQAVSKSATQPSDPSQPDPEPMMMAKAPVSKASASTASLQATAQSYQTLRRIVAKELGLSRQDPGVAYPKPTAQELQELKSALHFTAPGGFTLGKVSFTGAEVSLQPFSVKSKAKVLGAEEDVELSIRNGSLAMVLTNKLGGICETDLVFEYDRDSDAFTVAADLKDNPEFKQWLDHEILEGVQQISSTATQKFEALNQDLQDAQKAQAAAEQGLQAAQKAAQTVTKDAIARLQQSTDNYQHDYEYAQSQYNKCSGWKKKFCQAKWYPRKGLAWDAWQASKELLDDAEKALAEEKALEADVHAAQIKFDQAANAVALALKDAAAAGEIADILADGLEHFVASAQRAGGLFSLDQAVLAGSTADLAKGMPLVLDLFFTIDGKKYEEFFAVSPADAAFNALSFGLLPVIVAEHVVEGMDTALEKKLAPKFGAFTQSAAAKLTTWIQAHIYELIGGTRENMESRISNIQYELTQEKSRFKKVFDSLEKHAGSFEPGYQDLADTTDKILSTYEMTDFMPMSIQFGNRYIAVGHSALCLGVADNGVDVYQQNCKDVSTEQWTAAALKDADGKDSGYVQLKSKGLCLKAKSLDPKSGQLLSLAQCNSGDEHEKWKVATKDGFFYEIINRFSQKCLHFDTENANDKSGYAVWTSCLGADSQAFRVLEDAQKPAFYPVNDQVRANSGMCLAPDANFAQYFSKTTKGFSTADRDDHARMTTRRHNLLYPAACDGSARTRFNYVEKPDGALKIVHAPSGWCVATDRTHGKDLVLAPCNNGKDMFWRTRDDNGDAFEIQHEADGLCIDLPAKSQRSGPGPESGAAQVTPCRRSPSQFLDFINN